MTLRWMPPMLNRILAFLFILAAIGCSGGSNNPVAPTPAPTAAAAPTPASSSHGSISATIDGAGWNAAFVTPTYVPCSGCPQGGVFTLTGSDSARQTLSIVVFTGAPGTFPFANAAVTGANAVVSIVGGGLWDTIEQGANAAGSIVIATLTPTTASGTFSFVAVAGIAPATGRKTVTNGRFNVTF
jgi:hypothetical protein